jgi:hypothetical protein
MAEGQREVAGAGGRCVIDIVEPLMWAEKSVKDALSALKHNDMERLNDRIENARAELALALAFARERNVPNVQAREDG